MASAPGESRLTRPGGRGMSISAEIPRNMAASMANAFVVLSSSNSGSRYDLASQRSIMAKDTICASEYAHTCTEPKAMGVKTRSVAKRHSMAMPSLFMYACLFRPRPLGTGSP